MGIGKRLKEARENVGLKQSELGKLVGVTGGAIANYENEVSHPKEPVMYALINALHVEPNFLFQDCVKTLSQSNRGLTREAREVAEAYQGLDERGKGAIRAAIQYERHPATEPAKPKMPPKPKRQDGIAEIRVYDQVAAAGLGNYLDEPAAHTEEFPLEAVPERADFGVVISGDSMEPAIKNGATVFVQAVPTVEHGEIGIFVLNGKAYCKRLEIDRSRREVRLVSLNPAYEDIIIKPSDRLDTQGKVVGQYQR